MKVVCYLILICVDDFLEHCFGFILSREVRIFFQLIIRGLSCSLFLTFYVGNGLDMVFMLICLLIG